MLTSVPSVSSGPVVAESVTDFFVKLIHELMKVMKELAGKLTELIFKNIRKATLELELPPGLVGSSSILGEIAQLLSA